MKLLTLDVQNFKGIKKLIFDPRGSNADVYGTNEAGKTTVMDAFVWLLTGKDSQNATDFSIKPIGGLKQGAQVEVEGVFGVDGKVITLKKIFKEQWTKKRGQAAKEFTGHTTEYFVDEVPAKQKGFNEKIKEIATPDLFRMLTSPRYVNEEMAWKPRRELLIDVCGDVSDADVIATDSAFERIPGMIGTKTADEYRETVIYQRKGINDQLKAIPVRIDELQKSLPEDPVEVGGLGSRRTDLDSCLSEVRKKLASVEAGGGVAEKKAEIREVESQIHEHEAAARKKADEAMEKKRGIEKFCRESLEEGQRKVTSLERQIKDIRSDIAILDGAVHGFTKDWHEENSKDFQMDDVCPTCGQDIPEDKRQESLEKFNLAKSEALTAVSEKGKAKAKESRELKAKREKLENDLEAAKAKVVDLQADYDKAKSAVEDAQFQTKQLINTDPEYKKLRNKHDDLNSELSEIQIGSRDETADITAEIEDIEKDIAAIDETIAEAKAHDKTRARITELASEEKQLSAEFERLEADFKLLEDFTRAKCDFLTDRINSKFKLVKWELFKDLLNGGIQDICMATVGGVPYPDLNNAMKIRVGADVIRTLQSHYGVQTPVFFDNMESIVGGIEMECQVINLIVSEKDKKLRVEVEGETKNKAA